MLSEAIRLSLLDMSHLNDLTGGLYPAVARSFDTNSRAVERNMRSAVKIAWSRQNSALHTIFLRRPRNGELIRYAANHISEEVLALLRD